MGDFKGFGGAGDVVAVADADADADADAADAADAVAGADADAGGDQFPIKSIRMREGVDFGAGRIRPLP